jgi:hypothetical protein
VARERRGALPQSRAKARGRVTVFTNFFESHQIRTRRNCIAQLTYVACEQFSVSALDFNGNPLQKSFSRGFCNARIQRA